MRLLFPVTNSSNFYVAVLASPSPIPVPANELAYLAAVFFGSPVAKVVIDSHISEEQVRAYETVTKASIIDGLTIISPSAVARLSLDTFSPLYWSVDGDGRLEIIVKPPDVLRYSLPEAVFEGICAAVPHIFWKAFSAQRRIAESVQSLPQNISFAVIEASQPAAATSLLQWYELLVRMGVAPAALTQLLGRPTVGKKGTVFTYFEGDRGMAYWRCGQKGMCMFVPLAFEETALTNDLACIGYILNRMQWWGV